MAFKVQVGPPQIAIHQGQIILLTEPDGQIAWPSDKGLFFFDTRVLSAWSVYANGEPWDLLSGFSGPTLPPGRGRGGPRPAPSASCCPARWRGGCMGFWTFPPPARSR